MKKGILIIFVLLALAVVIFAWWMISNRKDDSSANKLRYHNVSEVEKNVFGVSNTLFDIKEATSSCLTDEGSYLITSKEGMLFHGSTPIYNFETVSEFDDSGEGGLLCIVKCLGSPSYLVTYTTSLPNDGQRLMVRHISIEGRNLTLKDELFSQDFPTNIHHAGTLGYDSKGGLYLSLGDGGPQGDPGNYAQNLDSYRGKILRLGDKPEIVAYGLRNPWKFSIDHLDRMWVADVGHNQVESLYLIDNLYPDKPYNCGWNVYEGSVRYIDTTSSLRFEDTLAPIFEYGDDSSADQTPGRCIIGGYFIEGMNIYIFGDYISGILYALKKNEKSGAWEQISKSSQLGKRILSLGLTSKNNTLLVMKRDGVDIIQVK